MQVKLQRQKRKGGVIACMTKSNNNMKNNSLAVINLELSKQWHPNKNGLLTPNDVTTGSNKKVWWRCEKGHEWEATVKKRTSGRNCPFCSGNRVCIDNCLQTLNPELAKQWHPTKNGGLTPSDVTTGSNKNVWWLCEKGHEWEISVVSRKKCGCPYCSGKRACTDNSLQVLNPELAKQWHPAKNMELTPSDVTTGSAKKVWWQCEKGHEWEATISNRGNGKGCPFCSGNRVCVDNCLQTLNPELAKQWHPIKNGDLTPSDVTTGSNKNVWWLCEKGHEWEISVSSRTNGNGCPFCSGKRVCLDNCLQTLNLELAKQWHPTKNGDLTPYNVTEGSNIKVWWLCEKGHEWKTAISHRSNGTGCPFCSGLRACADNCLQTINPVLSRQWHPTKNGDLTPKDVTPNSDKKVWWLCNGGHEWESIVSNRTKGSNCPYCSGQLACTENSLQTLNPGLSKQWHPQKNGNLTPDDVTTGSGQKAWWQCKKEHEWEAAIYSRNDGIDCPYCSGQLACEDNSLQTLNPELSKQWHLTKNGNLTPNDVTTGSGKKVWWQCEKGHEWEAAVYSRNDGIGCPVCNQGSQTSFPEQTLFFYLKSVFHDALSRYKHNKKYEIDVFIPSLNFGIEYDGIYYHKEKDISDSRKEKRIVKDGIRLLRVKETENIINNGHRINNTIYCNKSPSESQLSEIVKACFSYISEIVTHELYNNDVDVSRDRVEIYDLYIKNEKENSLMIKYPELSQQWHLEKI